MNNKTIAILAIIVVIAAGGCVAYFILANDSHETDYTLLDSEDKIKKGLTLKSTIEEPQCHTVETWVVDSVTNGMVNLHYTGESTGSEEKELNTYLPSKFYFDYTDKTEIPEGITVTKTGNDYEITGMSYKFNIDLFQPTKETYNLHIIYDGTAVTKVDGSKILEILYQDSDSHTETIKWEYSTIDSKVVVSDKTNVLFSDQTDVSDFYSSLKYDAQTYESIAVESEEKYGNVTVKVYTLNGTASNYWEYENYKFYVYNGYVIKEIGLKNGEEYKETLDIYRA